MPSNSMKKWYLIILLTSITAAAFTACKESTPGLTTIREQDIVRVMGEVETATREKDIEGVIRHMAPFVVITVSMGSPFSMEKVQMSRDQYKAELQKVFSKATRHEYRRENETIAISEDGKSAVVETDVIELVVMGGLEHRTTTHEKGVMEIIDGKILVTALDAVVRKDK
jgi:ketosteroid isomerase-like protein